jgi:hypothetical protein
MKTTIMADCKEKYENLPQIMPLPIFEHDACKIKGYKK